jgi:molybdopterin/thiamine biosynthesis adenylyltransferase/nitroreductase
VEILDPTDEHDRDRLLQLCSDPTIAVIDTLAEQRQTMARLCPPLGPDLLDEPPRWVVYPWRRAVVAVPGPRAFRRTRLDRNRNLITTSEQDRLATLRVGIIGLSVGHVIAHTLAMTGLCGRLRLADFDTLELPNLNRVPASVFDITVNKAVLAARRISELDPYLPIETFTTGITTDAVGDFLDGLDVLIEECDSLDIKLVVREAARRRGIPVLMSTGDRGMVDVERFDLEPDRPILHGLLPGVNSADLSGLSNRDKIPHMFGLLEIEHISSRVAASMVEVDVTLGTWPQLAGEVVLGAALVAEAVRRIGLGEPLPSGRTRVDIGAAFADLSTPLAQCQSADATPRTHEGTEQSVVDAVAAAAALAPSAGNCQPWRITTGSDSVTIEIDPARTSTLDVNFRASAVAVGAACFNAQVASATRHAVGTVNLTEHTGTSPLRAEIRLGSGSDTELARLYGPILRRQTNRRTGSTAPLDVDVAARLKRTARVHGAELHLLTARPQIEEAAALIAATDRIRYLTPQLHQEMVTEIRWPGDPDPDAGIEVGSLEFDPEDVAALELLRRADVMAWLASWQAGTSLGDSTRDRICGSSAIGVLTVRDPSLTGYAGGGAAAEAVWVAAQQHGWGIHPVSPLFLYARDIAELRQLSPSFCTELADLQTRLRTLTGLASEESPVIVFRMTDAPPPAVRSRRRPKEPS